MEQRERQFPKSTVTQHSHQLYRLHNGKKCGINALWFPLNSSKAIGFSLLRSNVNVKLCKHIWTQSYNLNWSLKKHTLHGRYGFINGAQPTQMNPWKQTLAPGLTVHHYQRILRRGTHIFGNVLLKRFITV